MPCHQDFHKGRLGPNCQSCHNFVDWKTINMAQFDHSKTRYPSPACTRQVQCAKCHTNGPDGKPQYVGIPFSKCSDCHQDPHHGSFPQACSSCHTTAGWKKISLQNVNRALRSLEDEVSARGQARRKSSCGQVPRQWRFQEANPVSRSARIATRMLITGSSPSVRDGGECSSCHNVQGWKPSLFTVKEHASTKYPLQGGHARLECDQCHIPKGKDTLYKVKFERCTDCHADRHAGQFVAAPYFNACDKCHNLEGYKPSTFTLAKHKQTRFVLTGGHVAVTCAECHKESAEFQPKPARHLSLEEPGLHQLPQRSP